MKSQNLSPQEFAELAISVLKKQADPKWAEVGQKYFKDHVFILGFSAAKFRLAAKELYGVIQPYWTVNEALALCELMLPDPYLEIKGLSIYILERFVKLLQYEHLSLIKQWIDNNHCDNWGTIDSMSIYIITPMIGFDPQLIEEVSGWVHEDNLWLRRASAVSLVKHVRKGRHIEIAHRIAESLFSDTEDLVLKASGWLLKESGKTDPERLEKFLLRHGRNIPRTTLRYAIERFPPLKRKTILAITKTQ